MNLDPGHHREMDAAMEQEMGPSCHDASGKRRIAFDAHPHTVEARAGVEA